MTLAWQPPGAPEFNVRNALAAWYCGTAGEPLLTRRLKAPRAVSHYIANNQLKRKADLDPSRDYRFLIPAPLWDENLPPTGSPAAGPTPPVAAADPPEALILVIDNAISLTHERFRRSPEETRVEAAWIMDAAYADSRVQFGRMWEKSEIDALLASHGQDDDALLRAMGHAPADTPSLPLVWSNTAHGTQIADIAAGLPMGHPKGPKIGILAVQLPTLVYWDAAGATLAFFAQRGVERMLEYARARFPGVPVVMTFSYSITGGPHNGAHRIERKLDRAIADHLTQPDAGIVIPLLPAGNSYDDRRHARAAIDAGAQLSWRLPPGDRSSNFLEIWVPEDAQATVCVTPPAGPQVCVSAGAQDLVGDGDVVARVIHEDAVRGGLRRILVIVAPTSTTGLFTATGGAAPLIRAAAPSGVWDVQVTGADALDFKAWVHRDDQDFGFVAFEPQSYLEDPAYEAQQRNRPPGQTETTVPDIDASLVKRSGSLSGIATGERTFTIAGRRVRDGILPKYSSAADYSASVEKVAPILSTASDVSVARPGHLAAGNRAGGRRWRSGTSAAVPAMARQIAEGLCEGVTAASLLEAFRSDPGARAGLDLSLFERQGIGNLRIDPVSDANSRRIGPY